VRYSERPELWEENISILSDEVWPEYNQHGDAEVAGSLIATYGGQSRGRRGPGVDGHHRNLLVSLLPGSGSGFPAVPRPPGTGGQPSRRPAPTWAGGALLPGYSIACAAAAGTRFVLARDVT
jgi:hypothetical protein